MARSLVADLSAQTTGLVTTIRPSLVPAPSPVGRDSLDELETAFARFDGQPDTAEAFRAAAERAHALVEAGGADQEAQRSASLAFAADALAAVAPEMVRKLVLNAPIGLPPDELPKPPEVGARSPWEWFRM